ncbi:MAG: hypothetical protein FJ388_19835, partial [Verrucomicrobia bacterium]|nr:hypothetical protein [Verrucomicrobiota bacterium]
GGSVMQAYGEGFEPGKVEVRGLQLHWPGEPKDKEKVSQAALDSARQTGLQAELPAAPPKEAQRCQVIDATAQVVAFVAPRSGQAVTAVWIRNGDSDWSAPFLANLPKPWWIDRETLAPVERATIYGRELSMVYRQPVILLRKDKDVRRAALADQYDVNYHHNSYVVGFLVPADAPQGEHEVWVHNGTGAEHGWAKAGAIRIASSAPSRPPKVIDARKHNAVGDGIADDTPALEAALAKAAKTGGGVVFLPPGAYRLSRCLRVPVGVSLKGAGQHNSLIVSPDGAPVRGGFPTELERWGERGEPQDWHRFVTQSTPMVWLQSQSALSDLCIEQRGGEGVCVLVANPGDSCDDVSITHCRIRNTYAGLRLERGYNPSFGGIWVPNRNRRLTISDNVIESVSSALVILSRTERGRIVRNEMRSLMSCHNDLFGARGGQIECVITDNRILDSKRGMTFQQPRPAMFHNYFARNTQEWVDRGGNANETLLLEGWRILYHGLATSGAETAITVNDGKWTPGEHKGRIALVIAGRGLGQYGYVADNTADTLTLARPWRVPVDKTTTFVLGNFFAENVFHAQNDRRSGA